MALGFGGFVAVNTVAEPLFQRNPVMFIHCDLWLGGVGVVIPIYISVHRVSFALRVLTGCTS